MVAKVSICLVARDLALLAQGRRLELRVTTSGDCSRGQCCGAARTPMTLLKGLELELDGDLTRPAVRVTLRCPSLTTAQVTGTRWLAVTCLSGCPSHSGSSRRARCCCPSFTSHSGAAARRGAIRLTRVIRRGPMSTGTRHSPRLDVTQASSGLPSLVGARVTRPGGSGGAGPAELGP